MGSNASVYPKSCVAVRYVPPVVAPLALDVLLGVLLLLQAEATIASTAIIEVTAKSFLFVTTSLPSPSVRRLLR